MNFETQARLPEHAHKSPTPADRAMPAWFAPLPGIVACLLGALLAAGIAQALPMAPMMLLALLIGAVVANMIPLPRELQPGINFSAKHLLRIGIVLLGLQIVLSDILGLGWQMLVAVLAVVAGGVSFTIWCGRRLGVDEHLTLLISCGFSICGAAAVAGAQTVVQATREKVATAIALVTLFGTLAIVAVPALGALLGLSGAATGAWAGASIHEVAQVVATAGVIGGPESEAMHNAVVVKLSRVVLLAAVVAFLGLYVRDRGLNAEDSPAGAKHGPLVPGFVIAFLAMVVVASLGILPAPVLDVAGHLQSVLLAMAMFALGCGLKFSALRTVGWRPVALGAASSTVVAAIAVVGVGLAL